MFFFGMTDPHLKAKIAAKAQEQEDILKIMMVFPAWYTYKSYPTYEQFVPFIYDAEAMGYGLTSLYHIYSEGKIPTDLDTLAREHAEHWRPAGEIVESGIETRVIEGPAEQLRAFVKKYGFPVKSLRDVAALTAANDFKEAMLKIETEAGTTIKHLDAISQSLLDMSAQD